MTDTEDKPDVGIHPPTLFFAALIVGYTIRVFVGGFLPLPGLIAEAVGGLMMLASLMAMVGGVSAFSEKAEELRPATPSKSLLTDGPYRYSRNPIYLGMVLFGAGFGLATENLWIILTTAAAGLIINFLVIPQEEAYLERRFGVDYREFKERVRRWV